MRRGRILIFLLLIVVVAIVVLVWGLGLLNTAAPTAQQNQVATTQVYYAAQNIPQGATITKEMLGTFSIPQENVVEVMYTVGEESNLIGQTARYPLDQGTVITSSMVGAAPGQLPGPRWATLVPPGMVASAIPTNRLATAAYGVNAGAHVNVTACMTFVDVDPAYQSVLPNYVSALRDVYSKPDGSERPYISIDPLTAELPARQGRVELDPTFQKPIYTVPSETQRPRLVCQMVLQDVVVLNLGNFELNSTTTTTDQNVTPSPAQAQQEAAPDIITLMVPPQDSIALNYFVYSGAVISMSLRNPNDTAKIDAQSATLTSILTQYNISLPSKLPYAQQPRLDTLAPPVLPNDIVTVQPQQ